MAKVMKRKTHRGAAKRFKVTSSGKIIRPHSGKRHLMKDKPAARMRKLRKSVRVHKADEANVRAMLPYA